MAGLEKSFPDIPILSEEGANIPYAERINWQRFWLVDSLDGTKEFIKHNGEFTINIALIEGRAPTLGVVGDGAFTQQGRGERVPIRFRAVAPEGGFTVVMSRSHPSPELEKYLSEIKVAETLPIGSSLKLCVVAESKADPYPRLGSTMEWDTVHGRQLSLLPEALLENWMKVRLNTKRNIC